MKYLFLSLFMMGCATTHPNIEMQRALDSCLEAVYNNCEGLWEYASMLERENARLRKHINQTEAETEDNYIADLWEPSWVFDCLERGISPENCNPPQSQAFCPAHYRIMVTHDDIEAR